MFETLGVEFTVIDLDWNRLAVEVVMDVCTLQNRMFGFKSKNKLYSVVKFPEGPMRVLFVREIMGEQW